MLISPKLRLHWCHEKTYLRGTSYRFDHRGLLRSGRAASGLSPRDSLLGEVDSSRSAEIGWQAYKHALGPLVDAPAGGAL